MKQVYRIELSTSGINELLHGAREYQKWLEQKTDELARRLADMGAVKASLGFSRAVYTGIEDHEITVEPKGANCYEVRASGETVLFVEFGTGLIGGGHPEAHGMIPGSYSDTIGKGHWDDPNGWWLPREKNGGHSQHTYGNPPNAPMYNTVKELEQELARVAREVFAA